MPEDVVTATTTDRIPEDLISTDIARATHTHSEFKNNLKITGNLTVSGNVVHNSTNLFDDTNKINSNLIPNNLDIASQYLKIVKDVGLYYSTATYPKITKDGEKIHMKL